MSVPGTPAPAEAVREVAWQLAVDAAGVGAWDWDLHTRELSWDDRLLQLFGLDRATFGGTIEAFNATLHPEDVPRVSAALATAIETCGTYAAEYRVVQPDGEVRWISARGRALPGPDGRAVRVVGAAYDTTAEQDAEARVARVLESMPTAFFQLDRSWRFSYLNSEAERLLGTPREDLVGAVIWEAFPASVDSDFETFYRRAADLGEPVAFDAYYPAPLDAWYEVRAWPSPDGLAVYFLDVTLRHEAQTQVTRAARRDALLAAVSDQMVGTLDPGEALARLGALIAPELGDWCVGTLITDDGSGLRDPTALDVGAWHGGGSVEQALVADVVRLPTQRLLAAEVVQPLLARREPLLVEGVEAAEVTAALSSGDLRTLLDRLEPTAAVVLVLRGRDRVVGLLTVLRGADRGPFSTEDVDTLGEVGARAGLALDNARLFAEQRDLAEALQRSLLSAPPRTPELQIAVRYAAAAQTAQVGGDWYDAFVQPDGATVVVIGDVVGHDTAAAAAMGQVRSLLRGIAVHSGDAPADLLRGVDRVLETLRVDTTATAVVARIVPPDGPPEGRSDGRSDGGAARVCWSNAGHPPPVLLTADGEAHLLDVDPERGADLLLGLDPYATRDEHHLDLPPGATLLLYTDGLVERRDEDLDAGLDRLRRELADLARDGMMIEELCDHLLARLRPSRREDDVALVAVRVRPPAADDLAMRLPARPESVPHLRRRVSEAVRARYGRGLAEDAELCLSELGANAVLHSGGTWVEVVVHFEDAGVLLTVSDDGVVPIDELTPTLSLDPAVDDPEATGGRGLAIVATLARAWGAHRSATGNRVWARLAHDGDHGVRPPQHHGPSAG